MNQTSLVTTTLTLCALFSASSALGSEVYKWVDEKGRTHYTQQRPAAGNAKAQQIKVATPLVKPVARGPEPQGWGKEAPAPAPAEAPAPPPKPSPILRGDAIETDASRCRLARAILSGEVRLTNGAQTDAHDRQVAQNDVRAYCGR